MREKMNDLIQKIRQDFDKDKTIFTVISLSMLFIPFLENINKNFKFLSIGCLLLLFIPVALLYRFKAEFFYKNIKRINIFLPLGIFLLLILNLLFWRR